MDFVDRLRAALADGYEIERELGRGGMAVVYLAHDFKHDRCVAVKVLRPEVSATLGADRFLREIQIAARLQHPHVLPLYDSGQAAGLLYYAMPYVEGETLRQRIRREKQLLLDDALQISREVADALSYAHSRDIVHRDIKPENILLSGGHAIVADFGVARAITEAGGESLTDSGVAIGTPAYMSPEQGTGETDIDGRSDIYSLGCVLFEMLAGEPPFTGPTGQAVIARHVSERPPSLRIVRPAVPVVVEQIVDKTLAKVPADRFGTAAELAAALRRSPRASAGVRGVKSRRRGWIAGLVGASLAVAAWVVWSQVYGPRRPAALSQASALGMRDVAVLYFDDNSEGQQAMHIANGLTEALIDELRRLDVLSVRSPNAARAYSRKGIPLDSVARALGTGTLVEGSIASSGQRLRVTARLVDGESGEYLDSRTIERPVGELFALQDSLTTEVSRFLRRRLGVVIGGRERRRATESVVAWELVQRAEAHMVNALSMEGDRSAAEQLLTRADSLLTRAESLDPNWIEPVVLRGWIARELADVLSLGPNRPGAQWLDSALRHAERALRSRPADPRALGLRGTALYLRWLNVEQPGDPATVDSAEKDLRAAAVVENPSQARAWATLSRLLQVQGNFAEANRAARLAYETDAFLNETAEILFRLYFTAMDLQQEDEAIGWCREGRARFPDQWLFAFCELTILVWPGQVAPNVARAWELVDDLYKLTGPEVRDARRPRWEMMVAGVLARADLPDSARAVIRRARAAGGADPEVVHHEAAARLLLGQRDSALTLLAAYLEQNPQLKRYIAANPVFRSLEVDPRFENLVRRDTGASPDR